MESLRASKYAAVPTDKDGGYCILSKSLLEAEKLAVMNAGWYREMTLYSQLQEDLVQTYAIACRRAARSYGDGGSDLLRALLSGIKAYGHANVFSVLDVLLKTHKAPGSVKVRGIHE